MALAVNEKSDEVKGLAIHWPMLEALEAGTWAMREAAKTLLPQWPGEEAASYQARLAVATLFPAYKRTVGVMSGKPFSEPLTVNDAPASIEKWAEDIDLQGVSLHSFAAEMFEECFYGIAGIMVDYPTMDPATGPRTVAQVEATGARPYFVRVKHSQILGWRSELIGGRLKLTQLRLAETREEPDGEWGTKIVDVVRVLTPGAWATYEAATGTEKGWVRTASGTTTLKDIPFVPLYGKRVGFMLGRPPLLDLAYLNVKHWQSQSDQDTIMHAARVPIMVMTGAEDTTALVLGASTAVKLPENGDLKFVEHSGAAIGTGAQSLTDLENQMIQTGAELLVKKPGDRSATEAANDAEGNKSDLQRMAENFQDCLNQALLFMAQWARLPDTARVTLFNDYGAATLSDASAKLVMEMNAAGLLSKATTVAEMQRRGVISSEIDVEEELEAAEADGPPLGMMGVDPITGEPMAAKPAVPPAAE